MRGLLLFVGTVVVASAPVEPTISQSLDSARKIGAPIAILPGAIWADRNSDGFSDGYVYQGLYHAGVPAGYEPNQTPLLPKTSAGVQSAPISTSAGDDYVEGRRLLDAGENRAAAAKLLSFYRYHSSDARAPASLLYLGQALTRLGQPAQACKSYVELEAVYRPATLQNIEYELSQAKAAATCKPTASSRAQQSGTPLMNAAVAHEAATDPRFARWGIYAELADKRVMMKTTRGLSIENYAWKVPGEVLIYIFTVNGYATQREFKWIPGVGALSSKYEGLIPTPRGIVKWDGFVPYQLVRTPSGYDSLKWSYDTVSYPLPRMMNARRPVPPLLNATKAFSYVEVHEQADYDRTAAAQRAQAEQIEAAAERKRRADRAVSGGGFGGFLKGAIAGAAGMAMGASPETATESAIAGAVAGGFLGAKGEDAGMIGSAAAQGSAQGTAEVDASNSELRRISEQGLSNASSGGLHDEVSNESGPARNSDPVAPSGTTTMTSARAHYSLNLRLTDQSTRNPVCYSRDFMLEFPSTGDRSKDYKTIYALMEAKAGRFQELCTQTRQAALDPPSWAVEGYDSFGEVHPHLEPGNDIVVDAP